MIKKTLVGTAFILSVLAALAAQYLLYDKSVNTPVPSAIKPTPFGELGVLLGSELLMLDTYGQVAHAVDLAAHGFKPFGDIEFFRNGDVLFYHRAAQPSIAESLKRFLRTQEADPTPQKHEHGLYRCTRNFDYCQSFGAGLLEFSGAFHLTIDEKDQVYISDTSRFVLYKLGPDGERLASNETGWKFPNGFAWRGDSLYVANTNHHRVEQVVTDTDGFAQSLESHLAIAPDTTPGEPKVPVFSAGDDLSEHRHRWPFSMAFFNKHWWVLVADGSMANARLLKLDEAWQNAEVVGHSGLTDAVALAVFDNGLVAIDWHDGQLKRMSPESSHFSRWGDMGLQARLADNVAQRQHYKQLSQLATGALVVVILIGLLIAWLLEKDQIAAKRKAAAQLASEHIEIPEGSEPLWLENKLVKKAKIFNLLIVLGLGLLIASMISLAITEDGMSAILVVMTLGTIPMMLACLAMVNHSARTKIGVQGPHLLIAHGDKTASSQYEEIYHNRRMISIGKLVVPLGNAQMPLYEEQELKRWVYPRLNAGKKLTEGHMWRLLWEQRHPTVFMVVYMLGFILLSWFFFPNS